jgi:DNA-binding LacI/PurR family transcriptional regulator/DNA-binding transcriptional regulator YhcF (GntR family)
MIHWIFIIEATAMVTRLETKNGIAKHLQLRNILLQLVGTEYSRGQVFHSERDLMRMFKVSSLTVSRAMKSLVADGIVERKVGGGTIVKKGGNEVLSLSDGISSFTLYVNAPLQHNIMQINPLNWFINSEIQRGIINSFCGKTKMLRTEDILSQIGNTECNACILITPGQKEKEAVEALVERLVCVDVNGAFTPAANCIKWECLSGVYELISYLASNCGHKKIALIAGASSLHSRRVAGFRIGCETFCTHCPPEYIKLVSKGTRESGAEALRELLALGKDRPTAVFVDTDIKAEGAMAAAMEAGLRIPEDISIAGFDDIPDAKDFKPPLTTVKVPYYEMGVRAVQSLIIGNANRETTPMKTKLIIRKSTGKVPK